VIPRGAWTTAPPPGCRAHRANVGLAQIEGTDKYVRAVGEVRVHQRYAAHEGKPALAFAASVAFAVGTRRCRTDQGRRRFQDERRGPVDTNGSKGVLFHVLPPPPTQDSNGAIIRTRVSVYFPCVYVDADNEIVPFTCSRYGNRARNSWEMGSISPDRCRFPLIRLATYTCSYTGMWGPRPPGPLPLVALN
jgi:hypothetical protein